MQDVRRAERPCGRLAAPPCDAPVSLERGQGGSIEVEVRSGASAPGQEEPPAEALVGLLVVVLGRVTDEDLEHCAARRVSRARGEGRGEGKVRRTNEHDDRDQAPADAPVWPDHARRLLHAHEPEAALAPANDERGDDEEGGAVGGGEVSDGFGERSRECERTVLVLQR